MIYEENYEAFLMQRIFRKCEKEKFVAL